MRVLLVNDWVAGAGGVERTMRDTRAALTAAGHDVTLLTSSAGTAADGTAEHVAYGTDRRAPQAVLQVVNPSAVVAVRRAVRAHRPDVALVAMFEMHLSPAVVLALWAAGVPTVGLVLYYKPRCPDGRKVLPDGRRCEVRRGAVCVREGCVPAMLAPREIVRYGLVERALASFARVLTCSDHMVRWLAHEGVGATKLHLPLAPPSPAFARTPSPTPLVVTTSRLTREKGITDLLDAAAGIEGLRLRIVGTGPERGPLEQRARQLGLDATFTGQVSEGDVERHLADAWALAVPSRWDEPLGLSAGEAVVRGIPAIVTDRGGLPELVEDGRTGHVVAAGDTTALRGALHAVAAGARDVDPDSAQALRARHAPAAYTAELEEALRSVSRARTG